MTGTEGLRALVLAAGLGTRLQPLTHARAKAAAPVDGEPLARRAIRWLVGHGVRDLVVNLHHKPESIAAISARGCATPGSRLSSGPRVARVMRFPSSWTGAARLAEAAHPRRRIRAPRKPF